MSTEASIFALAGIASVYNFVFNSSMSPPAFYNVDPLVGLSVTETKYLGLKSNASLK